MQAPIQSSPPQDPAVKVSVVVPVYNAGDYLRRRATSLLGQTMPVADYEVIYVDDGSTDDSAEQLAVLAAAHPNVRVHHQENSGWPGKPRNVGVELARGEYVQFVDQDDELAPDALAAIHELAARNRADIAFGKSYGKMQGPARVFREHREACSVADADLFGSLTPHKMFRREFLLRHGLRFPEGKVRLEDQQFLARAYPLAEVVSILGDRPTYHWHKRADGGNSSAGGIRPREYYGVHLRNVIRNVRASTEPGPLQDKLLARNYRLEILRHTSEPRILLRDDAANQRYLDLVRDLAVNELPRSVGPSLPGVLALRARLLEDGNYAALKVIAAQTQGVTLDVVPHAALWKQGVLELALTASLKWPDGAPVVLHRDAAGLFLDPRLTEGAPGVDRWPTRDPVPEAVASVLVQDAGRHVWWFATPDLEPALVAVDDHRAQVQFRGSVRFDPDTFAGGRPLQNGTYRWVVQATVLGLHRRVRLSVPAELVTAAAGQPGALDRDLYVADSRVLSVGTAGDSRTLEMRLDSLPPGSGRLRHLQLWANRDDRRRYVGRAAAAVSPLARVSV